MISDDFIVDDNALLFVPQHRNAGAAGVMRIAKDIDVGDGRFAVDGIEGGARLGAEFPPCLPNSGTVMETEITSSSFLSFRKISVRWAHGQASARTDDSGRARLESRLCRWGRGCHRR